MVWPDGENGSVLVHIDSRMSMVEESGRRVLGRLKIGWMDGVKIERIG